MVFAILSIPVILSLFHLLSGLLLLGLLWVVKCIFHVNMSYWMNRIKQHPLLYGAVFLMDVMEMIIMLPLVYRLFVWLSFDYASITLTIIAACYLLSSAVKYIQIRKLSSGKNKERRGEDLF